MADKQSAPLAEESGTTLAELLVVMLILGVIGAITTTGIVQGFNAQLASTNTAETLDGVRIATQRVRDFVRGADEVCASSTPTSLVLWTDDNGDGNATNPELDIFELVGPAGDEVFQRRVPGAGGEVQLIRDDIINATVFEYDGTAPTDQPASLECKDGVAVSDGPSLIRSVLVAFTVDNPDPAEPDLSTSTSVQVRNAGLLEDPRLAPTATFTFSCPAGTETCTFDASGSTDDDGTVVDWLWEFGDGTSATGETISHTFPIGDVDYDVTLTVIDNDGVGDNDVQTVRPGVAGANATPVASFTFNCTGRQCDFDASGSTDDSGIANYAWDFGDGNTSSGPSPTASNNYLSDNTYVVTLTVTDDDATNPLSDSDSQSVVASTAAIRLESLTGSGSPESGGTWDADIVVQLSFTTAGRPGSGITVSGKVKTNGFQDVSCSTDANGRCTIEVNGVASNKDAEFELTSVTDPSNTFVYDPNQNLVVSELAVRKNQSSSAPAVS